MRLRNNIDSSDEYDKYIQKFLLSAKQMNLTNKKEWLGRLIDSDKFLYRNRFKDHANIVVDSEKKAIIKTQIFQLIDLFNKKYEKNWDIHLEFDFVDSKVRFEIFFVIRYESITISNSKNQTRNLKNLFVILPVSYNNSDRCIYFPDILGTRLTLSHDEWYSGYMHSHLGNISKVDNAGLIGIVRKFCLGTSDLSELIMELSTEFNIEQLELMLYTIDSYITWESLEGVPYITMSNITIQVKEIRMKDVSIGYCRSLYDYFKVSFNREEINHLPFDFIYTEGRYKIRDINQLDEFIKNKFIELFPKYSTEILCRKGNDGIYYRIPDSKEFQNPIEIIKKIKKDNELPFVYIQGEKIEFSIVDIQKQADIDLSKYNIHPKFLNYVKKQFECELYYACVRGSAVNYIHNSSDYIRRDSE